MKTINAAVIGWGFMGRVHTLALRGIPIYYPGADMDIRLKCVCTRRAEAAREAMRVGGFETWTDDWRRVIEMEDVDVISVCTPNAMHEEMAVAALRAGKHICIDKPLADTAEGAAAIARAAAESKAFTHVLFHNRSFPAIMRAKQLIDDGAVGEVLQFSARFLHSGSIDPEKKADWKMMSQGGVLKDLGSHMLDLITYLIGYPERAICKTRRLYPQRPSVRGGMTADLGDDHAVMLLQLPGGAFGTLEASKIATGSGDELYIEILGRKGGIRWQLMAADYLEYFDRTAPDAGWTRIETAGAFVPGVLVPKNTVGWERAHMHSYYQFLRCIAENRPSPCGAASAARLEALIDMLFESDRRDAWVDVSSL